MKKRTLLSNLLKERGITAYKLSAMLGYKDKTAIYKWIYGKSEPNAKTMLKLSEILNVSAEEILKIFSD